MKTNIIAYTCYHVYFPWLVDLVLLLRLAAVYPPRTLTAGTSITIFAFPVLVKITRAVVIGLFCSDITRKLQGNGFSSTFSVGVHTPYSKIEWFLQFFDNA
jgi:hypothetical protein